MMAGPQQRVGILGPVETPLQYQAQQFGNFNKDYFLGAAPAVGLGGAAAYGAARSLLPRLGARSAAHAAIRGGLGEFGAATYPVAWLIDHARHFDNALQNKLATRQYAKAFGMYNPYEDGQR